MAYLLVFLTKSIKRARISRHRINEKRFLQPCPSSWAVSYGDAIILGLHVNQGNVHQFKNKVCGYVI